MIDRTIPPAAGEIQSVDLQEAKRIQLPNGTELFYISSGQLPVIRMELIYRSGAYYEPKNGQSYFAAKMLTEGSKGHTAKEIAQKMDYYGSFLEINPGLDQVSAIAYTLSKHLETICKLLREILDNPEFPEKELQVQKRIKKQSIKINQEKTNVVASQAIRKLIFGGDHPYGKVLGVEAVDEITPEDLFLYRESMLFNDPVIVVSGGVSERDLQIIASTFTGLAFSKDSSLAIADPKYIPTSELIEKAGSLQSSIRLGKMGLPKTHPDYIGLVLLNEILGGYFGSRLMKNIREDKGYTYGIYSSIMNLQHGNFMMIGTDVNREHTQATIDEIFKEIGILRNKLVSEEELATTKNYTLGNFMSSVNSPFSLADKFKSIHFYGLGYDFYQKYINTVKQITSEEIRDLANKYLQQDSFSKVVVGGY